MTRLRGGRWTAGNRPEPSRAHGPGRIPLDFERIRRVRRDAPGRPAPAGGFALRAARLESFNASAGHLRKLNHEVAGKARGRLDRIGQDQFLAVARTGEAPCIPEGVRGGRGRERAGPTRSHPEPGRDPAQRRRVLGGRPPEGEAAAMSPDPPDGKRVYCSLVDAGWSSGSSLGS